MHCVSIAQSVACLWVPAAAGHLQFLGPSRFDAEGTALIFGWRRGLGRPDRRAGRHWLGMAVAQRGNGRPVHVAGIGTDD